MRLFVSIAVLSCLVGASSCTPKMPAPPLKSSSARGASPNDRLTMTGEMVLNLFDDASGDDTAHPTFTVKSPNCQRKEDGAWTFESADATILGADKRSTISLQATRGELDHQTGHALLSDGVTAHMNSLTLELDNIEWRNDERVAVTTNPVRVLDGETRLQASGLRLSPDDRRLTLTDVSGMLVQQGIKPL